VTTEQLGACGLGKDPVAYRVQSGRLHLVFQSVYSVGCGELPPLGLELAALLACGTGTFVSHLSAAFLWGMRKTPPPEVEVSVVGRNCWSRKGIRVHRVNAIDKRDVRQHEGLWVSSPARALLEVAAVLPADELAEAVGEGIAGRLVNRTVLEAVLARYRGLRGSARLAAVIGDESAMAITRSQAERAFLKLIRDARLPLPEVNARLGPYRPDFLWPEQRLIVELDSYTFHAGPDRFQHDREKDLYYRDAGFDALRFTRWHVVHEPPMVLVRLAQALVQRRAA
jgi:very-short-patch-repair endonuclease